MHPVLFRLGPLTVHTYGVLVAIGFLVGILFAARQAKKEGIPSDKMLDLGFYLILSAIVGSRLLFIVVNARHYIASPLDIFKLWEGGLVFYGGILLAVPTGIWYVTRNRLGLWKTADICAPAIAIGHAFGRLGCFSAGCCYGKGAASLPWAVVFTDPNCLAPTNVALHPTQLYESAGELINFLILISLRKYKTLNGQIFMSYLILYSVLRFIVEFFRGDAERGFIFLNFSVSQGISIMMLLTGVIVLSVLRWKYRTT
jgi:phosphatidylglycerol:prolipoprotein diacylglycerol transferase